MLVPKLAIPTDVDQARLAAYLNDHLARMALILDRVWRFILYDREAGCAEDLHRVVNAIVEDDRMLRDLMGDLGIACPVPENELAALERQLERRRPACAARDRIVELDQLVAGTRARAGMWACVDGLFADASDYDGEFAWRALRAEEEAERLERRRVSAALAFWRIDGADRQATAEVAS